MRTSRGLRASAEATTMPLASLKTLGSAPTDAAVAVTADGCSLRCAAAFISPTSAGLKVHACRARLPCSAPRVREQRASRSDAACDAVSKELFPQIINDFLPKI